jgi:hypothetical protein
LILDTAGFEAAVVVVNIGVLTGVTGAAYLTFTLQESNDIVGAHFTPVSNTPNMLGTTPSGAADFGDQNAPFESLYPQSLLPPGGTLPALYLGLPPLNSAGQAQSCLRVGYIGSKRYIRLTGAFTGAPSAVNLGIIGLLGHAQFGPVVSPAPITAQ